MGGDEVAKDSMKEDNRNRGRIDRETNLLPFMRKSR